jgi:carbon monoxide dehydrogenase subunit G
MIETEQTITIDRPIDLVWDHARDIRGWAELMPGMREFDLIDDDNSRWTLKVGVGGLVRTVKVNVRVDKWDGPGTVLFSYELEGDPVKGGGSYQATPGAAGGTDIVLHVRVEGGGAMAPMWEAMGRPLLPTLAKAFAAQLKERIEQATADATGAAPAASAAAMKPPFLLRVFRWIRSLFGGKN